MDEHDKYYHYRKLGQELARRTSEPLAQPNFVVFLILAVVGVGGLGFWIELYAYLSAPASPVKTLAATRTAVMTMFPAVVGSAALQAIWAQNDLNFRSIAIFAPAILFVVAIIVGPNAAISDAAALTVGLLAWAVSLWVWILVNADAPEFRDHISPTAAIGGDNPSAELPGNLDEFTH